jgi:hypothetical protein
MEIVSLFVQHGTVKLAITTKTRAKQNQKGDKMVCLEIKFYSKKVKLFHFLFK